MALFGLLASNATPTDPAECFETMAKGNERERWQAAYALAKLLADREAASTDPIRDGQWAEQMVALFRDLGRDRRTNAADELARRYLATAMGHLGHASALPALLEGAEANAVDGESDERRAERAQTRIYCTWALARIGDPTVVPNLIALSRDRDADVRTMAVYALGAIASSEDLVAIEALKASLQDSARDVQWNAALALARHGDAAAVSTVAQLCDRAYLATVQPMTEKQRAFTMQNGVRAARALATDALRATVERLAAGDPDEHVRHEARTALEHWGTPLDAADGAAPAVPAPGHRQG